MDQHRESDVTKITEVNREIDNQIEKKRHIDIQVGKFLRIWLTLFVILSTLGTYFSQSDWSIVDIGEVEDGSTQLFSQFGVLGSYPELSAWIPIAVSVLFFLIAGISLVFFTPYYGLGIIRKEDPKTVVNYANDDFDDVDMGSLFEESDYIECIKHNNGILTNITEKYDIFVRSLLFGLFLLIFGLSATLSFIVDRTLLSALLLLFPIIGFISIPYVENRGRIHAETKNFISTDPLLYYSISINILSFAFVLILVDFFQFPDYTLLLVLIPPMVIAGRLFQRNSLFENSRLVVLSGLLFTIVLSIIFIAEGLLADQQPVEGIYLYLEAGLVILFIGVVLTIPATILALSASIGREMASFSIGRLAN